MKRWQWKSTRGEALSCTASALRTGDRAEAADTIGFAEPVSALDLQDVAVSNDQSESPREMFASSGMDGTAVGACLPRAVVFV